MLRSRHVVALIGAGMSAESGIPTFRGEGGLWEKKGEPDMRGYQEFLENPERWWRQRLQPSSDPELAAFGLAMESAEPNPGHYALAEMEKDGHVQHLITQNVDNLQQKAGSRKITEIHGNRFKVRCINCGSRFEKEYVSTKKLPPRCDQCQGILKGDGVMFGEPIPRDALDSCQNQANRADCMLLLGTSALVYPAAGLPLMAQQRGARLIEVNPTETALTGVCDLRLRGASGTIIPKLRDRIKAILQDAR